jgi:polyphosphate kinase
MSEVLSKLFMRVVGSAGKISVKRKHVPEVAQEAVPQLKVVGSNAERLFNREVSDLQFIERVMDESDNKDQPLFERVRFLAIAADVLDQFFAVRVAKMRRSAARKDGYMTPDGLTPNQQLTLVTQKANGMLSRLQSGWQNLKLELSQNDIHFPGLAELSRDEKEWLSGYFRSHFLHVLTPFTIDEEHPFPFIPSGGLCAILELSSGYILLPLPANMPRFLALPGSYRFVNVDLLIQLCWHDVIPGEELRSYGIFQILRDNDLAREERSDDLRAIVESGLRQRHKANVIQLNVTDTMSDAAIKYVTEQLGLLSHEEILFLENRNQPIVSSKYIATSELVGLASVAEILDLLPDFPDFIFSSYKPRYPEQLNAFGNDCFAAITDRDMMVHWPYESFDSVIRFLDQAANDPDVIAIKQTLYRTSDESPIVASLITAAKSGKTVLAVVELEARDNEQSNIALAKRMEDAGVQIVYGIIGLKIHSKATLVVRMEDGEAVTYAHLGTGNYHPKNARTYTDISFFTRDPTIGYDTHLLFSYLTSEKIQPPTKLALAPYYLRNKFYELIDREISNAKAGLPAHICIKVNALTDVDIIERFYEASEAGVEIDLIIRRQCCLRPGVPGMSSRIRVKSIVGRFLEHSRVYVFGNGQSLNSDNAAIYFGSADLMERNLDERTEILVPVEDEQVRRALLDGVMHANVIDTKQSWMLNEDNAYIRVESGDHFDSQSFFMAEADTLVLGPYPSIEVRQVNEKS